MATTAVKAGQKQRQDFYMRTGNTRRIRVTLYDADDAVIDAAALSDARFVLKLGGGDLTLTYLQGIVLDRTHADGKARPRVDIEADYTIGEAEQKAQYELALGFSGDRDSVLYGKFFISASYAEPDETAAAPSWPSESSLDSEVAEVDGVASA